MNTNQERKLYYYDVTLSLPYLNKTDTTKLKIPAFNQNQVFEYLENVHLIKLESILAVEVYEVTRTTGNTRIQFKRIQIVDNIILSTWKSYYKRQKSKKSW